MIQVQRGSGYGGVRRDRAEIEAEQASAVSIIVRTHKKINISAKVCIRLPLVDKKSSEGNDPLTRAGSAHIGDPAVGELVEVGVRVGVTVLVGVLVGVAVDVGVFVFVEVAVGVGVDV